MAVWVGFGDFGIASDSVSMATYLNQVFDRESHIRYLRCARPPCCGCAAATSLSNDAATTIIALIPVLSASGRGADILVPMAIPTVGGMVAIVLTAHLVPVLYCALEEWKLRNVS